MQNIQVVDVRGGKSANERTHEPNLYLVIRISYSKLRTEENATNYLRDANKSNSKRAIITLNKLIRVGCCGACVSEAASVAAVNG